VYRIPPIYIYIITYCIHIYIYILSVAISVQAEAAPMPPKQLRLHGFFKSTGRSTPDTGNADIRAAAKEVILEKLATTSNLDFVKNGSRDRYGHARTNAGGRPKKVRFEGDPTISSNRRQPGTIKRREFSAQEKIQMIFKIKGIRAKVRADNPEACEEVLVRVIQKSCPQAVPDVEDKAPGRQALRSRVQAFTDRLQKQAGARSREPAQKFQRKSPAEQAWQLQRCGLQSIWGRSEEQLREILESG
jgi:hypothetical protein